MIAMTGMTARGCLCITTQLVARLGLHACSLAVLTAPLCRLVTSVCWAVYARVYLQYTHGSRTFCYQTRTMLALTFTCSVPASLRSMHPARSKLRSRHAPAPAITSTRPSGIKHRQLQSPTCGMACCGHLVSAHYCQSTNMQAEEQLCTICVASQCKHTTAVYICTHIYILLYILYCIFYIYTIISVREICDAACCWSHTHL